MPDLQQVELLPLRTRDILGRVPKVLSYGGGKDSFCMLITAIDRGELPDHIVFMDVGNPRRHPVNLPPEDAEPAEWPETYEHMLDVAAPLAQRHGIPFHWIISEQPTGKLARRMKKAGITPEVYPIRPGTTGRGKLKKPALGLFDFFLKMGMVPATQRQICTQVAKIDRFNAWVADRFAGEDVEVWIGFNADERHRKERGKTYKIEDLPSGARRVVRLPLDDAGLTKQACIEIFKSKRLPIPAKSACVFCPFGKPWEWLEFFARYPGLFYQVVDLWNRRRERLTEAGYEMAAVFSKFELSPAMYQLLLRLARPVEEAAHRGFRGLPSPGGAGAVIGSSTAGSSLRAGVTTWSIASSGSPRFGAGTVSTSFSTLSKKRPDPVNSTSLLVPSKSPVKSACLSLTIPAIRASMPCSLTRLKTWTGCFCPRR